MLRTFAISALCATMCSASSLATMSTQEREALADELAQWKNSTAGKAAKINGFYNDFSLESVDDDQLTRFLNTKNDIEILQKSNPEATFSTNSPFSLMTNEEFTAYVKRASIQKNQPHGVGALAINETMIESVSAISATNIDWTTSGCVGPVRNQGQCGSCWAFSAVAAVESAACLQTKKYLDLSEQQITSCSTNGGSQGCNGGWPSSAIDYMVQNGVCLESAYPYKSGSTGSTGTCSSSCTRQKLPITRSVMVGQGESLLQSALNTQPVVVVVTAGNNVWKQYTSGIVSSCPSAQIDHAVLAVGYSSGQYFKIKNSWGASWGESGYIRLKTGGGASGTCKVASNPTYPQKSK